MSNFNTFLKDRRLNKDFKKSGLSKTRFLKEKGLSYAFRKEKTIKRRTRFIETINGEKKNFISYKRKAKIITYKRKGKTITYKRKARTIISDNFSLRNIFVSKFSIKKARNQVKVKKSFTHRADFSLEKKGGDVLLEDVSGQVNLLSSNYISRKKIAKGTQILEKRGSPLKNTIIAGKTISYLGKIFIRAEFKFQDGTTKIGEGQSVKSLDLSNENNRQEAINEALTRAVANTGNSGVVNVKILSLRYEYRLSAFKNKR